MLFTHNTRRPIARRAPTGRTAQALLAGAALISGATLGTGALTAAPAYADVHAAECAAFAALGTGYGTGAAIAVGRATMKMAAELGFHSVDDLYRAWDACGM